MLRQTCAGGLHGAPSRRTSSKASPDSSPATSTRATWRAARAGQPENAARGIYHFMRVPDPLDAGVAGMRAEVKPSWRARRRCPMRKWWRYRDPWEPEGVLTSVLRTKVREEVTNNFQYVVNEAASERGVPQRHPRRGRGYVRLITLRAIRSPRKRSSARPSDRPARSSASA